MMLEISDKLFHYRGIIWYTAEDMYINLQLTRTAYVCFCGRNLGNNTALIYSQKDL